MSSHPNRETMLRRGREALAGLLRLRLSPTHGAELEARELRA